MKIQPTKEWCEKSAEIEGDSEVGAGAAALGKQQGGKPCSAAYLLGASAAVSNEAFDSPFREETQSHRDWVDGYQDQQAGRLRRP